MEVEKKEMTAKRTFLIYVLVLLILNGCGYKLKRASELQTDDVALVSVVNLTNEPGLEDTFRRIFTEAALMYGIEIKKDSKRTLKVKIIDFDLKTLSIKKDLSAEYAVEIRVDIEFITPEQKQQIKGLKSEYVESFISSQSITSIQAQKEIVIERSMYDLSRRIITELNFGE
jgi:outer membrane lipopolysaccharide assembly protein LptE/RlpB